MSLQDCHIFLLGKNQPLWGVTCIITKSCITLRNTIEHLIVYCPFQRNDDSDMLLFIHFNQITPDPCLSVTPFQAEFLSVKILQHSSSIWHIHLAGAQHCIFPAWKLLHKLGEDDILFITLYKAWPPLLSHCCFCSCHCHLSFHTNIHVICRSVFQTVCCSCGMYYLKTVLLLKDLDNC
jgi:hypothetical protein